jgi:hypothetical protein
MPSKFNLNTLKGRMAEQLVQDLFLNSGYNVFNFGLERLHPYLSQTIKTNNRKTSKNLRFMPDFVVQSQQNGDLFYLEVKFRANGCFEFNEDYEGYPYHNAWFVVVSPQKIQCLHYKSLKLGKAIKADTAYSMRSVKSFHIERELLDEYEKYASVLFASFGKK